MENSIHSDTMVFLDDAPILWCFLWSVDIVFDSLSGLNHSRQYKYMYQAVGIATTCKGRLIKVHHIGRLWCESTWQPSPLITLRMTPGISDQKQKVKKRSFLDCKTETDFLAFCLRQFTARKSCTLYHLTFHALYFSRIALELSFRAVYI